MASPPSGIEGELVLWLAILILVLAGVFVARGEGTVTLFHGSFIVDPFARVMKLLTLTGAAAALLMSIDYWRGSGGLKFEFPVLVLLASTGMMMMISANDLISLYVGLELQSLALYVVAAFNRDSSRSAEAGLKYFVLGALSSGMLLYGARSIYGFTGSTDFAAIAAACSPRATIDRPHLRPRLPDGGLRLQDFGRALPYVDARRL